MLTNIVIRQLIFYDVLIQFSFGLLNPIFAVFILDKVKGSNLEVIGLATTFYWLSRVLTTVPLSRFMDKTDGERDEFYFALTGAFIVSLVPLMYIFASEAWHVYVIQLIFGLANSMAVPAWRILFIDHLDKGKTGFEWSLEDVGVGIAVGSSAYFGSIIAERFGFRPVLVIVAMLGYLGTLMLIPLYRYARTLGQIKQQKQLPIIKKKRKLFLNGKMRLHRVSGA